MLCDIVASTPDQIGLAALSCLVENNAALLCDTRVRYTKKENDTALERK